jgi:hypothetical protein
MRAESMVRDARCLVLQHRHRAKDNKSRQQEVLICNVPLFTSLHDIQLSSADYIYNLPLRLRFQLQLVPIIRIQISQLHLLILSQSYVPYTLLPLPVRPRTHDEIRHAAQRTQTHECDTNRISRNVLRPVLLQERKHGDDATDISESNLPCCANCATMMAAQVHIEPTHDDGHGRVCAASNQKQGAVLKLAVVVNGDEYCEAGNADADWQDGEEETVLELVGEVCDDHTEAKSSGPRRNGMQLRLDGRVAVALDNGRGEISVSVGRYNQPKVHETADEDLGVFEDFQDVSGGDGSFAGGFALVDFQSGFDVGTLVFGEPFTFFREVRDQEEEEERHDAGQEAFEDEDPSAEVVSADIFWIRNYYLQPL